MKAKHKSTSATSPKVPGFTGKEQKIETSNATAVPLSMLMEVEQTLEPKGPHALDTQFSGERLKGKMGAKEEVSGESERKVSLLSETDEMRLYEEESGESSNKGIRAVEDGQSGLQDDFFKLSVADSLPHASQIHTPASAIGAVPLPVSKGARSDVRIAKFFHLWLMRSSI